MIRLAGALMCLMGVGVVLLAYKLNSSSSAGSKIIQGRTNWLGSSVGHPGDSTWITREYNLGRG